MKIIAALTAALTRGKTDEADLFDLRLQALTKPAVRAAGQRQAQSQTPVLFRRELGHA